MLSNIQQQDPGLLSQQQLPWWMEYGVRPLARAGKDIAVGTLGGLGDLANIPVNAGLGLLGMQQLGSPSEQVGQYIDQLTGGLTAPRDNADRVGDSIGQMLAPIPAIGAGMSAALKGLPKLKPSYELSQAISSPSVKLATPFFDKEKFLPKVSESQEEYMNRFTDEALKLPFTEVQDKIGGVLDKIPFDTPTITAPQRDLVATHLQQLLDELDKAQGIKYTPAPKHFSDEEMEQLLGGIEKQVEKLGKPKRTEGTGPAYFSDDIPGLLGKILLGAGAAKYTQEANNRQRGE